MFICILFKSKNRTQIKIQKDVSDYHKLTKNHQENDVQIVKGKCIQKYEGAPERINKKLSHTQKHKTSPKRPFNKKHKLNIQSQP